MSAENHDIKRELSAIYAPRRRDIHLVEVPDLTILAVDGSGDPNRTPAYGEAVVALFRTSYAVRAQAIRQLGRRHTVGPLEGLWSAADPGSFVRREKDAWSWTMLIAQPSYIPHDLIDEVLAASDGGVRPERRTLREGMAAQVLHIGSYDDEGPVLARLHDEFMPEHGLTFAGLHHEVYLSDPRRTAPERLRTVIRQPVRARD